MDRLSDRHQALLKEYIKVMVPNERRLIFGPQEDKFFKEMKLALHSINVGCHALTSDKDKTTMYVDSYQADKLMNVLIQLTNQTCEELTNGTFVYKSTTNRCLNHINWSDLQGKSEEA